MNESMRTIRITLLAIILTLAIGPAAANPQKPVLHGKHWVAITGKPLGASAGARIFYQGGNAVDAACAMLAATSTMWDVLSWGGETQALIYHPGLKKVIGINALGVAPTGATPAFYREQGLEYPPEYGPLAAVTPGTPGGLLVMLAEYGSLSLKDVLQPAIEMAEGYPIEEGAARAIERDKQWLMMWPDSRRIFLSETGDSPQGPKTGQIFRQPDLRRTLEKLVEAEQNALANGADRKAAIYAAYDRFYRGDIARELTRATQNAGGLITMEDLDRWQVYIEEPVSTSYKGIDVYKLTTWVQGPVLLQALNIVENFDVVSMGYNSTQYIHTLYQAMNLAFADRDFYYGDPYYPPEEPVAGLLSKDYAKARARLIDPDRNDPTIGPGDPYEYQDGDNPYLHLIEDLQSQNAAEKTDDNAFFAGTTSIQAADAEGWVVSITPSGAWIPAFVAGDTGIGLSQRMQSFVLTPEENPYNVLAPGKRPRATLTPSMALKDGKPFLSFAVQGGDAQDQNLLQFFLNMVEFGMNVQEAAEADNFLSYQMHESFGEHKKEPGRLAVNESVSEQTLDQLSGMGYAVEVGVWGSRDRTSGPINAIWFDHKNGTMQGGSSNHGDDYGIAW